MELLSRHSDAFLFPWLTLNTPSWWKDAHPDELIKYGIDGPDDRYDIVRKQNLVKTEGGHYMGSGRELWEASLASKRWLDDTDDMLRAFIRHIESSPLCSRVIGYFLGTGRTGEWNYFGSNLFPDYSAPMQRACGQVPSVRRRMNASYGLLRDPASESDVMDFYACLHDTVTDDIVRLAHSVKAETKRRVICGTFYGYLTESVRIQDAGFLAPLKVFDCPDIDLIACPYAYQNTNITGEERWESDMEDGAGNRLGRARGVGGDAAFRAMVASVRKRGKLFVMEADPSTYLDVTDSWRSIGGSGSKSVEGTLRIMRRDLGKFWADGCGGWLYDFGPYHGVESGWYGDQPIIDEISRFSKLMEDRTGQKIGSVAEVAVMGDTRSFFATRHWMREKPWTGYGIRFSDVFNHWFLNAQSRTINRIGTPVDWFLREDFLSLEKGRHKLLIVPNTFLLEKAEIKEIRHFLSGSGMTVVWMYAPGFLTWSGINPEGMESLTGFRFKTLDVPGKLMISTESAESDFDPVRESGFGLKSPLEYYPRFEVTNDDIEILGRWTDAGQGAAFARRQMDGWTSVYCGTAPLPVNWLRTLCLNAGVSIWSSEADIISASQDAVMLVATESGQRTLQLPKPMSDIDTGRE
ncbi:MAG: hypothetical protein PVF33_12335, partial [Candidatus Latescibacterota bacterium]